MQMKTAVGYDDVLLTPRYSTIKSRSEVDLSINFKGLRLKYPVFSSPMDSVTGSDMATLMAAWGGIGVIHRYQTEEAIYEAVSNVPLGSRAISVGIKGYFETTALYAVQEWGVNIVCVDVANGHNSQTIEAVKLLRSKLPEEVFIMAGNVGSGIGAVELVKAGADMIRCGIGSGNFCSTAVVTGHGMPTLQATIEASEALTKAGLREYAMVVADGGIRSSGDGVKALAAGADAVMLGSYLTGTDCTPGPIIMKNGYAHKEARGMASTEASSWNGPKEKINPEGISTLVPFKGNTLAVLETFVAGLRSGFSYSGASNLAELHENAWFVAVTDHGHSEGHPKW